jgi:hypothetical protein
VAAVASCGQCGGSVTVLPDDAMDDHTTVITFS